MMQALLLSIALAGQIVGPEEFPRDTAGEYGCQCAYPKDEPDVDLQIEWSSPSDKLHIYPHPEGDTTVYVVGPPGTYELKSDATVLVYLTLTYLEPGPKYPGDPLDVTRKTQRFIKSYDSQNYSRPLTITGGGPGPNPPPYPTSCEDVPDDKWSIGKTACVAGQKMPATAKAVAPKFMSVYEDIAGKVERFELKIPSEVSAALSTAMRPVLEPLTQADRDAWTLEWSMALKDQMANFPQPGMGDLPAYYRALANGLKAVK